MSLISNNKKAIFVRIPKTGSTSMYEYLCSESRYGFVEIMNDMENINISLASRIKEFVPIHSLDTYFKFCFVRNPWDRYVSAWKYLLKRRIIRHSFSSFVKEQTKNIRIDKFKKNIFWHSEISNIFQITDDKGEILVDFVGKFENLEEDFAFVCKKLCIPFTGLPHINRTNTRHYSDYYTEETKWIIAEKFKDDISAFGYEFEGDVWTKHDKSSFALQPGNMNMYLIQNNVLSYIPKKLRTFVRNFLRNIE